MALDEFFPAAEDAQLKLQPVDAATKDLALRAQAHVEELRPKAVEHLAHQDKTLKSEFNPYDLYQDVSYYQRCRADGTPEKTGEFYRGVELSLYSSMDETRDCVAVDHAPGGTFRVFFGGRRAQAPEGVLVNTQDKYNTFRLERQIVKALQELGAAVEAKRVSPKEHLLRAAKEAASVGEALEAADKLVSAYIFRVGLESRAYNLMKRWPNFLEITDENIADWVRYPNEPHPSYQNIVILTATRICRRCTREWPDIVGLVQHHPKVKVGIAFIDKPKFKFMPKVFDEDCGEVRFGDKVTPFVIFYKGGTFQVYYATKKDEPPPAMELGDEGIKKYFGPGL